MSVTDTWYLTECSCYKPKHLTPKIRSFADKLSFCLIKQAGLLEDEIRLSDQPSIRVTPMYPIRHTKVYLPTYAQMVRSGQKRTRTTHWPTQRRCIWCSRLHDKQHKTQLVCRECNYGFCDKRRTGRNCWQLYMDHNGPPAFKGIGIRPVKGHSPYEEGLSNRDDY